MERHMQVGDLVRFKNNGMIGLVIKVTMAPPKWWYKISWVDGHVGNRTSDELEVISGVS